MIFLTGGTGMVGAHLLLHLTQSGAHIRALRRKQSDLQSVRRIFSWYSDDVDPLWSRIEWIEGDLCDKTFLGNALEGITTIINAAAKVSFDPHDRLTMLYENIEGTANLVDLAIDLKINRFCHVSSIAALGGQESGFPVNEELSWKSDRERSAYAESKFQSEIEVWRGIQEGLSAVIVNPAIILGPGNWENGSPRLYATAAKGSKFYTEGSNGFVDVRDVAHAIALLVSSTNWETVKNQRYVLSAENLSYRDLFNQIAVAVNQKKPVWRAGQFILKLGWRMAQLAALFTGKVPALTRDTVRSAGKPAVYDGTKITKTIDFSYTPIAKTIENIGKIFLAEHQ